MNWKIAFMIIFARGGHTGCTPQPEVLQVEQDIVEIVEDVLTNTAIALVGFLHKEEWKTLTC